jgi:DNA mismatch endonuclease (patch repair protein)
MPLTFSNTSDSRRDNMRAIRSRGNRTTEARLRGGMVRSGIRGWTLHSKQIFGVPDFFFRDCKMAVFVDGCFWHGCPRCGHIPKTNAAYWVNKIERNKARDVAVNRVLVSSDFTVVRFWECEIRKSLPACIDRLAAKVESKLRRRKNRPIKQSSISGRRRSTPR